MERGFTYRPLEVVSVENVERIDVERMPDESGDLDSIIL